ncbi:MAG: MBL fold metallo-hydrolase, partial [Acidimicrobiales bacterium]
MSAPGPAASPVEIAPGVIEIDTLLGGWERLTGGFLVGGARPVLVETGSQTSVPVLLGSLGSLGVSAADLAGVVVTHIHLDHAGGVGDIAAAFPDATVYVHPKGARHLEDPTRLVDSAARVYGPRLDSLYGRLAPTPRDRLEVLEDGDSIDLGGGRSLTAIDSPGHAKHHVAMMDSDTGMVFAGDAVGVLLPDGGVLRPATPPPDFDLDLTLSSLARIAALSPASICLTHYGLVAASPSELLTDAADRLREWAAEAERAWRAGEDIAEALRARFEPEGV